MSSSRLYNVRDIFWEMPSGSNGYLTDSTGQLSTRDNFIGYNTETVGSGSPYEDDHILFHGTGLNLKYNFRITSDPIIPEYVNINMHASNIESKLFINNIEIGNIGNFGNDPETIYSTFLLSNKKRKNVLNSRNYLNYDTWYINSINAPIETNPASGKVYGLVLDSIVPGGLGGGDNDGVISVTSTTTPSSGIYDGENFVIRMTINNLTALGTTSTGNGAVPNISLSTNPAYPFDLVYVSSNPVAGTINSDYWEWGSWSLGGFQSQTWDLTLKIHGTGIPPAISPENQSTEFEMQGGQYVSQLMYFDTDSIPSGVGEVYNPTAIYGFEIDIEHTNNETFVNYISDPGSINSIQCELNSLRSHHSVWKDDDGTTSSLSSINQLPSGLNANDNYIYLEKFNKVEPTGYLQLGFKSNYSDQPSVVTRAILTTNMSFPYSGSLGNYRDRFGISGYNSERTFLWGNGEIVENSGFVTYTNDLYFIDLSLINISGGHTTSRKYATLNNFEDFSISYIGLPSGTQLSSALVELEVYPFDSNNLFTTGIDTINESSDLFVHGFDTVGSLIDDFAASDYIGLWGIDINDIVFSIYISGHETSHNNQSLYINGFDDFFSNKNLYTSGYEEINNLPSIFTLNISGHENIFDSLDIYISSSPINTELSLYTFGITSIFKNYPLFISGLDSPDASGTTDLRIKGNTELDLIGKTNLFVKQYDFDPEDSIPLFIKNIGQDSSYKSLNLIIGNTLPSYNNLNLYIKNSNEEINSGTTMFIKPSYYYSLDNSLNLHIQRDFEGIPHGATMFIQSPTSASSDISTMYVKGVYSVSSLFGESFDDFSISDYIGLWGVDEEDFNVGFSIFISGSHTPNYDTYLYTNGF